MVENELRLVSSELDTVLQRNLTSWAEEIGNPGTSSNASILYCLYPRLVSELAWARGTLASAEKTQLAMVLHRQGRPLPDDLKFCADPVHAPCCSSCHQREQTAPGQPGERQVSFATSASWTETAARPDGSAPVSNRSARD